MAILDRSRNKFIEDVDTRVSVGIDFPFARVGGSEGYFKTTKTTVEKIKNNIRLLLQTNQGERLFQPNLGMNLRELLFEQLNDDTRIQIENNIVDVFQKWLPFVELRDIQLNTKNPNQINVSIVFNIRRTPNMIERVNVAFDTGGGLTNVTDNQGLESGVGGEAISNGVYR